MSQTADIDWLTAPFAPITLDALNTKAEMMSRIDNKYVVKRAQLQRVIPDLTEDFDILDIKDQRAFTYDTRYFDDPDRSAYFEHHQGLRKGFKVRARSYVDAGLCFLEVKVKGARGMTEKFRMPYEMRDLDGLTHEAASFAKDTYTRQYDKPFSYDLSPSLDVRYKRITLVAREGGERMTIDTDLRFTSQDRSFGTGTEMFIVETKSANGRGQADLLLRKRRERPMGRCSKYCIGMAATGQVSRYNRFLPALRKLGLTMQDPVAGRWAEIRSDLGRISKPQATLAAVAAE